MEISSPDCGVLPSCSRHCKKFWLYRNHLLCGHFPLDGFQAGLPYAAEPVIIIRFCDAVMGTPGDNAHAGWTTLAVPDLSRPFLETALLSHYGCF